MQWLFLVGAILFEVIGTLCLRMTSTGGRKSWYAAVVGGYLVAFAFLTLTLHEGLALGVA